MITRTIQFWLWVPFWLATRPALFGMVILGVIAWKPQTFGVVLVSGMVIGAICMPIEAKLRPMDYGGKSKLPRRGKPMGWARVRIAVKKQGSSASLTTIRRRLPIELKAVLSAPINRQPEAVAHDSRLAQQQAAE